MKRIEALKELLGKVKTEDALFPSDFPSDFRPVPRAIGAFEGSLDAAKALHEAVLPDWDWGRYSSSGEFIVTQHGIAVDSVEHTDRDNPARAWLIAILKALISIEEAKS